MSILLNMDNEYMLLRPEKTNYVGACRVDPTPGGYLGARQKVIIVYIRDSY